MKPTWLSPARSLRTELLDEPQIDEGELEQCLGDLERINRFLGGSNPVLRQLWRMLPKSAAPFTVLDIGTGGADIPRAIVDRARQEGRQVQVSAIDNNPTTVAIAKRLCRDYPEIILETADARVLGREDQTYDFVISSLTFHHFDDQLAADLLRDMARKAKLGVIVSDLRRGYLPALLIAIVTRLALMGRLTRHDASLSVLRSRTASEYRKLATAAGLPVFRVYEHPFWRAALVAPTGA